MRHVWLNYEITNDSSIHFWWAPKRTWNLGKMPVCSLRFPLQRLKGGSQTLSLESNLLRFMEQQQNSMAMFVYRTRL